MYLFRSAAQDGAADFFDFSSVCLCCMMEHV